MFVKPVFTLRDFVGSFKCKVVLEVAFNQNYRSLSIQQSLLFAVKMGDDLVQLNYCRFIVVILEDFRAGLSTENVVKRLQLQNRV